MLSLGGALVLVGTSMLSPYPVPLLGLPAMGVHAQGLASRVGELALQASTSVLNMPNTVVGVLQQVTASPLALLPSVISGGSLLRSGSGLAVSDAHNMCVLRTREMGGEIRFVICTDRNAFLVAVRLNRGSLPPQNRAVLMSF